MIWVWEASFDFNLLAAQKWILETVNFALKAKGKHTDSRQEGEIICRKGQKEADNQEIAVMLLDYLTANVKRNVLAFNSSMQDLSYLHS